MSFTHKYLVTLELETSLWLKFLRFLRIKPGRKEFILGFLDSVWKPKDLLSTGEGTLLIIKKLKR